jgi:hypothetical protein
MGRLLKAREGPLAQAPLPSGKLRMANTSTVPMPLDRIVAANREQSQLNSDGLFGKLAADCYRGAGPGCGGSMGVRSDGPALSTGGPRARILSPAGHLVH